MVWLICDITMLQTGLDPTHEKKKKKEQGEDEEEGEVEEGAFRNWLRRCSFWKEKQVRSSLPKQQHKHLKLQLLQGGGTVVQGCHWLLNKSTDTLNIYKLWFQGSCPARGRLNDSGVFLPDGTAQHVRLRERKEKCMWCKKKERNPAAVSATLDNPKTLRGFRETVQRKKR